MLNTPELLNGTCRQFLFSPDGAIAGVLLTIKGRTVQIRLPADIGVAVSRMTGVGRRLRLLAEADPATPPEGALYPLYAFTSFTDAAGRPVETAIAAAGREELKGMVDCLHFGPHGEPDGVVLVSGELVHLGAAGMIATGLKAGSKLRALGEVRITLLGTRMLRATQVNGLDLV